jgi:hypothetical protein
MIFPFHWSLAMRNAHDRFGTLEFTRQIKDTTTHIRLYLDRFIGEIPESREGEVSAHLLSVVGGDAEVAAVWAAIVDSGFFTVEGPDLKPLTVSLGQEARCFRGTIAIPGRKRPARHLVGVSAEMAKSRAGADREGRRTILCDGDAVFVLYRLAQRYGLPVLPEWAGWFRRELEERKAIQPLVGLGCDPVVVRGGKKALLHWIGRALKKALIGFPAERGPIRWKLPPNFLEQIPGFEEDVNVPVEGRAVREKKEGGCEWS